jgi:hypothetical protein
LGPSGEYNQRQIISYFARNTEGNEVSIPIGKSIGPAAFRGASISLLRLRSTTVIDPTAFDGVEGNYAVHVTDTLTENISPESDFCLALRKEGVSFHSVSPVSVCSDNVSVVDRVAEETSALTTIPADTKLQKEELWLKATADTELVGEDGSEVAFWRVVLEGTAFSAENLEAEEKLTMRGGVTLSVRSLLTFGSDSELKLAESERQLPLLNLGSQEAQPPSKVNIEVSSLPEGKDFVALVRGTPFENCEDWRKNSALSSDASNSLELICWSETDQSRLADVSRSLGLRKKTGEEKSGLWVGIIVGIAVGGVAVVAVVVVVIIYVRYVRKSNSSAGE